MTAEALAPAIEAPQVISHGPSWRLRAGTVFAVAVGGFGLLAGVAGGKGPKGEASAEGLGGAKITQIGASIGVEASLKETIPSVVKDNAVAGYSNNEVTLVDFYASDGSCEPDRIKAEGDRDNTYLDARGESGLSLNLHGDILCVQSDKNSAQLMQMARQDPSGMQAEIERAVHTKGGSVSSNVYLAYWISGSSVGYCGTGGNYWKANSDGHNVPNQFITPNCPDFTVPGVGASRAAIMGLRDIFRNVGVVPTCSPAYYEDSSVGPGWDSRKDDLMSYAGKSDVTWHWHESIMHPEDYLHTGRLDCQGLDSDPHIAWQVKSNVAGNGSIISTPASKTGGEYPGGTKITFTATPRAGSKFVKWNGDCASNTTNKCELVADRAHNVYANFTTPKPPPPKKEYRLYADATGPGKWELGKKIGKHIVQVYKQKGKVVAIRLVPDNKNSAIDKIIGCDNKQLKKPNPKTSGVCYELIDHSVEKISGLLINIPPKSKYQSP